MVIEYNVHISSHIEASIEPDENWVYQSTRDCGASFAALYGPAAHKGYRLIHIHGPWNLFFLRNDLNWSAERSVCSEMYELLRPGGWALPSIDVPVQQIAV